MFNKAGLQGEYREASGGIGNYEDAKEELQAQLENFGNLAEEVNIERVVQDGVTGAKIGGKRGARTAGLGFILAAGYRLYVELSEEPVDESAVQNIDPDHVAERVVNFQRAAERVGDQRLGLAGGAIGAALAIDESTPGQKVPTAIASMDAEWITRPLESGDTQQGVIRVASEVIESYSQDIGKLFDENLLEDISN